MLQTNHKRFNGFEDDAIYQGFNIATKIDGADLLPFAETAIYTTFIDISDIKPLKNPFTKFKRLSD